LGDTKEIWEALPLIDPP